MIEADLQFKGVPAIAIASQELRAVLLPTMGGNIASLYDQEEGQELLCQSRLGDYAHLPPADTFEGGICAGIDDMFPNAIPCTIQEGAFAGTQLPGHGEAWRMPWQVLACQDQTVRLELRGKQLPYRLQKDVTVRGNALRMDYRLENLSPEPFPFLWAAHPQFQGALFAGIQTGITGQVLVPFCIGPGNAKGRLSYPVDAWDDGTPVDLRAIPPKERGIGYKYTATAPLGQGQGFCRLIGKGRRGDVLITFPTAQVPYLGVWMDACSDPQAPAYVVAPEPSTHHSVDLNAGIPTQARQLPGKGTFTWWVQYTRNKPGEEETHGS